jgi:GNAT superfamily N-acetyltransferase
MNPSITYKSANTVPPRAILDLFRRNAWREWFTMDDTRYLLRHALLIASAWDGRRAAGIAVLWGDGRFYTRLDVLLVDEAYQRRGIGSSLMRMVVAKVDELKPHYCEHDIHEPWLEAFYGRFGFERYEGPWLVHAPTCERLVTYVETRRKTLRRRGVLPDE